MTTTASLVFKAAHAAANLADKVVAYRTRFSTALRAAWAATKQIAKTIMRNIIATITVEDPHATPGTVPAKIYDVYHLATEQTDAFNASLGLPATTTAFAVQRPLREGGKSRLVIASTLRGTKLFDLNGQTFNRLADSFADLDEIDARDAKNYGFTLEDVAAAKAAINA